MWHPLEISSLKTKTHRNYSCTPNYALQKISLSFNIVKGNTCFKENICFTSISTNGRYSPKHTSSTDSTETGLSDHHHLISSMMKTKFEKEEPIILVYRDYKHFSFNSFKSELLFKFHHSNVTFTSFENNFVNVLNQQAPKNPKVFLRQSKAPFK